ncbi:E3 ubiquitin-protein ligase RAD18 Ecym_2490 [Eremothecium cymbalariae DBVPG|uniref:Postreplication repair E3 ubiquitin-protein ligase RAD18 n=1 Tax=Eremothecium cymbalariae (strain CBS 270.75 / DBVPG 7215 / KCTC 17166 / NRRL Y-17582) TaxID=931890 RepID=G8JPV4_ERECY|nr:Hypothetical protein Ecym_2490 [Eremothecium cymbalariae DBVPG\
MTTAKLDAEVSNPSDFQGTLIPEIADIDSLLRCHICKEFLQTPVLGHCGHTFCSLCIRTYLNKEARCPLCLVELRQNMLQKEFLLGEIVASYSRIRGRMLENLDNRHAKRPAQQVAKSSASKIEIISDDDIQILDSGQSSFDMKRSAPVTTEFEVISKRPRAKKNGIQSLLSRKSKIRDNTVECPICNKSFSKDFLERTHLDECLTMETLHEDSVAIDIPQSTVQCVPEEQRIPESNCDSSNSGSSSPVVAGLEHQKTPPTMEDITSHTNLYLESGLRDTKPRLPKLHFGSLSTNQLKQKLSELNLPNTGSKQQMINRYNHYELLWNSNFLDSIQPVSELELRKNLANWESTHNTDNYGSNCNNFGIADLLRSNLNHNLTASTLLKSFKSDRFDKAAWIKLFSKEFNKLIREARKGLNKQKEQKLNTPEVVSSTEAAEEAGTKCNELALRDTKSQLPGSCPSKDL